MFAHYILLQFTILLYVNVYLECIRFNYEFLVLLLKLFYILKNVWN
jgi:hypothetical protein